MRSAIEISRILSILLLIQSIYSQKTVELLKAQKIPNSDANVVDYGNIRVAKQSKDSKNFTISGTFQIIHNLKDEELGYSLYHKPTIAKDFGNTPTLQKYNTICEFMKEDTMFYPGLKAASNLPDQETCPFPKGSYTIKDFTFSTEKLGTFPPGDYKIMLNLRKQGKFIAGYEVYVTLKP